ncbi:MAG: HEAT repeat domain-containing protein [Planctomycetes bacterium]|nr:HEAT repeat domain-containing protein [Planctomycetota bacterium]
MNSTSNHTRQLIAQLAHDQAAVRMKARDQLVHQGGQQVTRELVQAMIDPRAHVRWEAAKALQAIADPVSASALMNALEDEDQDVRWVAAEALVSLGKVGVLTVLSGLTNRAGSLEFCRSAHHVLRKSQTDAEVVARVQAALELLDCAIAAPPAAFNALVVLSHASEAIGV